MLVFWVWRSLVACMNGVHEAGSSSLLTQTKNKSTSFEVLLFLSNPKDWDAITARCM